jgi:hypothetical protein
MLLIGFGICGKDGRPRSSYFCAALCPRARRCTAAGSAQTTCTDTLRANSSSAIQQCSSASSALRCRVEPYWIKATALRAAAPGRARAGRAAWRPVPPQRAGQCGALLRVDRCESITSQSIDYPIFFTALCGSERAATASIANARTVKSQPCTWPARTGRAAASAASRAARR